MYNYTEEQKISMSKVEKSRQERLNNLFPRMTAEEKQGLVDAVELAIDFNMDISAEDIEVYEYIVANRGGNNAGAD